MHIMRSLIGFVSCLLAFIPPPLSANTGQPVSGPLACGDLDPTLGKFHKTITTSSPLAQAHFDQGMIWAYGFNHEAAERSFRKAAQLDPDCAMCHWGIAYVLGPNINAAMAKEAAAPAYQAAQKALSLVGNVSALEKDLIEAMAKRYAANPPEDRAPLDRAFAEAMAGVASRHPSDADVASIHAEAIMDTMPWNYWQKDRTPRPGTLTALAALRRALQLDTNHLGANHFMIHVTEQAYPEWGVAAADRLRDLNLGAGHLVHMPSHTYIRVGRYDDALTSNLKAIEADRRYLQRCKTSGIYGMMYVPHNMDFAVAAAGLEGRRGLALQLAQDLRSYVEPHLSHGMLETQQYWMTPALVMARFGMWNEILRQPKPAPESLFATGLWHFTRALSLIRLGNPASAEREIDSLQAIAALPVMETTKLMTVNAASRILQVGVKEARGELKAAAGNFAEAIAELQEAVRLQDDLRYTEPPPWFHSVRLALGAVLLQAGRTGEAEAVFRRDLKDFQENGWALRGLVLSLEGQGRSSLAKEVKARFAKAWARADVRLASPRY